MDPSESPPTVEITAERLFDLASEAIREQSSKGLSIQVRRPPHTDERRVEGYSSPEERRLKTGSTPGYLEAGHRLNLNAVAIGVAQKLMSFDEDNFPAVFYQPDGDDATAILFQNGVIACVDAPDQQVAEDVCWTALERAREFMMLAGDHEERFHAGEPLERLEIPVPATVLLRECPGCGEGLRGSENFCPECGQELPDPASLA